MYHGFPPPHLKGDLIVLTVVVVLSALKSLLADVDSLLLQRLDLLELLAVGLLLLRALLTLQGDGGFAVVVVVIFSALRLLLAVVLLADAVGGAVDLVALLQATLVIFLCADVTTLKRMRLGFTAVPVGGAVNFVCRIVRIKLQSP